MSKKRRKKIKTYPLVPRTLRVLQLNILKLRREKEDIDRVNEIFHKIKIILVNINEVNRQLGLLKGYSGIRLPSRVVGYERLVYSSQSKTYTLKKGIFTYTYNADHKRKIYTRSNEKYFTDIPKTEVTYAKIKGFLDLLEQEILHHPVYLEDEKRYQEKMQLVKANI